MKRLVLGQKHAVSPDRAADLLRAHSTVAIAARLLSHLCAARFPVLYPLPCPRALRTHHSGVTGLVTWPACPSLHPASFQGPGRRNCVHGRGCSGLSESACSLLSRGVQLFSIVSKIIQGLLSRGQFKHFYSISSLWASLALSRCVWAPALQHSTAPPLFIHALP